MASLQDFMPKADVMDTATKGVDLGVKLATMQETVEKQRQDVEAQKIELVNKRLQVGENLASQLVKMDPKIRGKWAEQFKNQARKADIPMDGLIDAIQSDPSLAPSLQSIMSNPNWSKMTPEQKITALTNQNPMDHMQGLPELTKMWQQQAAETTKGEYDLKKAEIMANGKTDALSNRVTQRITSHPAVKQGMQNANMVTTDLSAIESALEKDKSGNIKGMDVSQAMELATSAAKVLAGSAQTSADQRDKLELTNLSTKMTEWANKVRLSGRSKVTDQALLGELHDQFTRFHDNTVKNLETNVNQLRGTYNNPDVMDAQENTIRNILAPYKARSAASGLAQQAKPDNNQAVQANLMQKIQQLRAQGKTDADIMGLMKASANYGKAITDDMITKALGTKTAGGK